jgi:Acetyltransferase (GNAT) domain
VDQYGTRGDRGSTAQAVSRDVTIERYDSAARAEWDALVAAARARHFLFERAYMDYHSDRFTDASLIVLWGGRPIAAFPASRHGAEIVSHGGLTFGGLLSGPELTVTRAIAALDAIAVALRADGARRLVYKPIPHLYHLAPAEEDLFALQQAGARLVRRDVSAAISPGPRPDYSKERRRAVTKGRRAEIELCGSDRIEAFMALVDEMLRARHGVVPVHSAPEMRLLADRFPDRIRLWTACERDAIVAGVLVYETPAVAHAQYIASSSRGRELGAGDAVIDHLVRNVYAGKWFDLGISNERSGELNAGLMRNKEGFGARAVVHDQYELDLA